MIARALAAQRSRLLLVFLALAIEVSFNSFVPLSLRYMIDDAIAPRNRGALAIIVGLLAGGALMATAAGFLRDYLFAEIQSSLLGQYRAAMFDHLQRISMAAHGRREAGEVLTRFSGDLAALETALVMAIPWAILPALEAIFNSALLFLLNWQLALLAMLTWPWTLLAARRLALKAEEAAYQRKQQESALLSRLAENLSAQLVIKAFNLRSLMTQRFARLNDEAIVATKRANFLSSLMERSTASGILVIQVAVLGFGGYMAFTGQVSTGILVSFQALVLMLSNNLLYVMQYGPSFVQAKSSMRRVHELLDEPESDVDADGAAILPSFEGGLAFRQVSFTYTGQRQDLDNINLEITKGTSAAFVGGSGSGKSTALSLLMRSYDATSGGVYVNGVPVWDITRDSFRSHLGVVFQESFLFNASIRENIRLGNPAASDTEVEAAAKAVEIHDVITSMPDGYETVVGDRGGRLSGGQRQRIAIARAVIRDPAILLLDEATSALDPATEATINQTLAKLGAGRTVVSVTHRLLSITRFDVIFVFDKGRVVESGTHDVLVRRGGTYARLWAKQSGFEIAEEGATASVNVERLRAIPILSDLSADQLQQVAEICASSTYHASKTVFEQGDASDKFYIIVRGRFHVIRDGEQIATLEDGDYFGEIALLTDRPRNATIRAISESLCLTLDRRHFQKLLLDSPLTRRRMEEWVSTRLLG